MIVIIVSFRRLRLYFGQTSLKILTVSEPYCLHIQEAAMNARYIGESHMISLFA